MGFKKGHTKVGGIKKGGKANKTLIKERIGLTSWEKLQEFMLNEGAEKFIEEASKLEKQGYIMAFNSMLEYFKPKLQRSDNNVNVKAEIKNFVIELTDDSINEANKETNGGISDSPLY